MSSSDVISLLKSEFAGKFVETQVGFMPHGDELIESKGSYFRRVEMEYVEYASSDMHGACSQYIYVWFSIEGTHAGTYVQDARCPV